MKNGRGAPYRKCSPDFLRFQSWVPSKGCSAEDHSISRSSGTAAACASAAIPHANGDPNSALNPFQKEVYQENSAGHSISEQKSTKCQSLYRSFISITIPTKKWCNLRGGGKLKLTKRFPLKPKLWKFQGVGEPRSGAQASSVGRCPLLKAVPTSAGVASPQQHKIPGACLGKTSVENRLWYAEKTHQFCDDKNERFASEAQTALLCF